MAMECTGTPPGSLKNAVPGLPQSNEQHLQERGLRSDVTTRTLRPEQGPESRTACLVARPAAGRTPQMFGLGK